MDESVKVYKSHGQVYLRSSSLFYYCTHIFALPFKIFVSAYGFVPLLFKCCALLT